MSLIERWTIKVLPEVYANGNRMFVVSDGPLPPGNDAAEGIEVVRAATYRGAVEAITEVVWAWDAWQEDAAFEDPFAALVKAIAELRPYVGGRS